MGVRIRGITELVPLEIRTLNQKSLKSLKLATKFRIIYSFIAMTVYLPV